MFVYHINNILTDYDTMYDQLEEHGASQVVRGRRSKTVKNIQNWRDAETELAAWTIDVDQFLDRVSYNNETLVSRLHIDFANFYTIWDSATKISGLLQLKKKWILTKFEERRGSKIGPATPIWSFKRFWREIQIQCTKSLQIWYKVGTYWG